MLPQLQVRSPVGPQVSLPLGPPGPLQVLPQGARPAGRLDNASAQMAPTRARMTTDSNDEEVFLVPVADDLVLAIPVDGALEASGTGGIDLPVLIEAVGPLVGKVLKRRGIKGATYYELSPESQKMLQGARRDFVGDYFRGVIRQPKGQFKHSLQLREVESVPAPTGVDPLMALQMAQMAAIQAQLGRIEDAIGELSISVEAVLGFLEGQQRSSVEEALQILREVHDRARLTGTISSNDWDRLMSARVEAELGTQLRAVRRELVEKLSKVQFGNSPSADSMQMKAIKPKRVGELVELHRMLLGGLRGWNELLILRKFEAGELTETEIAAAKKRLSKLESQHSELLGLLGSAIDSSKKSRPRGTWERLFSDGLWLGGSNDDRNLKVVRDGRAQLKKVRKSVRPAIGDGPSRKVLGASTSGPTGSGDLSDDAPAT